MTAITVNDLTQATLDGAGVFDVLMRANKAHLEDEFGKGRIKGAEYAQVYLGSLTQVMQTALQLLLSKEKIDLEAQLLQKQILLAQVQIDQTNSQKAQIDAQTQLINQQRSNLIAEATNIPKQGALLDAQKDVQVAAKLQTEAETLNLPKQGLLIEAQKDVQVAAKLQTEAETLNLPKQGALIDAQKDVQVAAKAQTEAQTLLIGQQKTNLVDELLTSGKQRDKITQEITNLGAAKLQTEAQTAQLTQQTANLVSQKVQIETETLFTVQKKLNAVTENDVLVAQKCKLQAEYDLTIEAKLKTAQETALLTQKVVTERAQTQSTGVDENSVMGRQKALYAAQTNGFNRDAEQKAADLMIKSWMAQATTNDQITANSTNKLADTYVGRAVEKLLSGVNA